MNALHTSLSTREGAAVLKLSGAIDRTTCDELAEVLHRVRTRHAPHIILDLTEVTFVDSSGLDVLTKTAETLRTFGGSLGLVRLRSQVQHLLGVLEKRQDFRVFDTVDEALASVPQKSSTAPAPPPATSTRQPAWRLMSRPETT